MRHTALLILIFLLGQGNWVSAQCNPDIPPVNKKVTYAKRVVTFTDVSINGQNTTYLAVRKGEKITVKATVQSDKRGDYCPNCIVQIYWGIRGHTSICAKSFHGYSFRKKKTSHQFQAPMEDGIYYITMGATLDYSCKNNKFRPNCSPDDAFAVLKVGNPDPEEQITLIRTRNGGQNYLQTTLVKGGCYVQPRKIEWFYEGKKLDFDDQRSIPVSKDGNYEVSWSNCLNKISRSIRYQKNEVTTSTSPDSKPESQRSPIKATITYQGNQPNSQEPPKATITFQGNTGPVTSEEKKLEDLVEESNKFVLKNLVFDLRKATLRPEAKLELNKLADIMLDKPSVRILLEGHTDRRGGTEKNLRLSEQRVKAAKAYLKSRGIRGKRIKTKGWGDQKPLIVTDDVEEGRINRRVEVTILKR